MRKVGGIYSHLLCCIISVYSRGLLYNFTFYIEPVVELQQSEARMYKSRDSDSINLALDCSNNPERKGQLYVYIF